MNKLLDIVLGLPGAIVFCFIVIYTALLFTPPGNQSPQNERACKQAGGKWVQTMKTYHTCNLENKK